MIDLWMSSNRLRVNPSKTVSMLIGTHQKIRDQTLNISLSGMKISPVTTTKYSGLYIDNHLRWDNHIDYVLERVRAKMASIARLQPLTPRVIAMIYKAFVVPSYDYCDTVWQPSSAKMCKIIKR